MVRLASLAELCLLAWGFYALVVTEFVHRLGPNASAELLTWLRWLLA